MNLRKRRFAKLSRKVRQLEEALKIALEATSGRAMKQPGKNDNQAN